MFVSLTQAEGMWIAWVVSEKAPPTATITDLLMWPGGSRLFIADDALDALHKAHAYLESL